MDGLKSVKRIPETKHDNLKQRTKVFALRITKLVESLPKLVADLMNEGSQLTAIWVSSINTARGKKRGIRTSSSALRT